MTNPAVWIALAVGVVALAASIGVFLSFAAVRRRLLVLQGKAGQADILQATARQVEHVTALREEIRTLSGNLNALSEAFRKAIQRVAIFRYDAFEDMGGKLSFSAAFLDANGDGVVITCINGRQEARTYSKPVEAARSVYNLSPEEEEAIRRALSGQVS